MSEMLFTIYLKYLPGVKTSLNIVQETPMDAIHSLLNSDLTINDDIKCDSTDPPYYHYHDVYEIYLLLKGTRYMIIDGNVFKTYGGDVAIIRPGELHRSYGDASYEGICFNFSYNYLNRYYTPEARAALLKCLHTNIISLPDDIVTEIVRLSTACRHHPELGFAYFSTILGLLSSNTAKRIEGTALTGNNKELAKITSYIGEHYTDIENLDELSNALFISKGYLCNFFKKHTGETVIHYINSLKIQHACFLLSDTDKSINKVADECGFESAAYFNHVFKSYIHLTPNAFRKSRIKAAGQLRP